MNIGVTSKSGAVSKHQGVNQKFPIEKVIASDLDIISMDTFILQNSGCSEHSNAVIKKGT